MNKLKKYAFTVLTAASLMSTAVVPAMASVNTDEQATEQSVERKVREKKELTEEQKAEMLEKAKERLASQLAEGTITQEEYDEAMTTIESGKMPKMGMGKGHGQKGQSEGAKELTEEQKTEMLEKVKERLASQLAEGTITQEKYDEAMTSIESGKMPKMGMGKGHGQKKQGEEAKELTEEQKAEMVEKAKERFASQLAEGTITQEEYDEAMTSIESGKMPKMGNGKGHGQKTKKEKTSTES